MQKALKPCVSADGIGSVHQNGTFPTGDKTAAIRADEIHIVLKHRLSMGQDLPAGQVDHAGIAAGRAPAQKQLGSHPGLDLLAILKGDHLPGAAAGGRTNLILHQLHHLIDHILAHILKLGDLAFQLGTHRIHFTLDIRTP